MLPTQLSSTCHSLLAQALWVYVLAVLWNCHPCCPVAAPPPPPAPSVCLSAGQVVYTSGHLMRVTVVATKHQQLMEAHSSALHASVTNDFTFVLAAVGAHPLRPVEPESLREAVQYLAAHRQHLADGYQAPELLLKEGMEHVLLEGRASFVL